MPANIYGLDDCGLEQKDMARLKDRWCTVRLHRKCDPITRALIEKRYEAWFKRVEAAWPALCDPLVVELINDRRLAVSGKVRVADLAALAAVKGVRSVDVESLEGYRKVRRPKEPNYYCVRGRVVVQVEGQTRGLQSIDDSSVLVMASSEADAKRRALRFWAKDEHIYLNMYGELVRWRLEEIIDIWNASYREIDPKGTEVYSWMCNRRMKPEYEWHPRSE